MSYNPRLARLAIEYTKLMNLAGRSRFIKIEPIEVAPGWPPEKYIITYTCKGIAGVDGDENPISSNFHQVQMYMGRDYPDQEPFLKWLTPIWHPNIEHDEPHKVCTNNVQNWYAAKPLVDLVAAMGEMVQYKRYHAKWVFPFPLDQIAADWVMRYAEPKGLIGPDKPYDRRPLVRPRGLRNKNQPKLSAQSGGGMTFGQLTKKEPAPVEATQPVSTDSAAETAAVVQPPAEPAPPEPRIRFGNVRSTQPLADAPAATQPAPADNGNAFDSVEVLRDGQSLCAAEMPNSVLTIGRGGEGDTVALTPEGDESVDGLYAVLLRDDSGLWLTAAGETPLRVNGRQVPRGRTVGVAVSDSIEIGDFSLRIK